MQALLRSELYRARLRTQPRVLMLIMAGILALFYGGFTVAHFFSPDNQGYIDALSVGEVGDNGLALVYLIGSILVVIFSSSLIGSEYGWNTLRPLLARSSTRNALLTAKWATVLIYVMLFTVVSVVVTLALATIGTLIVGEGFDWTLSSGVDAVGATLRYIWGLLPLAALAMSFAVIARSNAAGIALGIAYVFVEPVVFELLGALNDVFYTIGKGGMIWNATRVFTYGTEEGLSFSGMMASAGALAIWIGLLVGVSYWLFNRRDVTSG